nr:putative membrane protein [Cedratvirus duvanny]
MVNSVVLLIVVVVIVLGILLSFGLFFLLRNSDTKQTTVSTLNSQTLPFASCQTSSQCLTSQICSNGRCTNVVDNLETSALGVIPPPPVPVKSNSTTEIENLERMMERQNGNLKSLQVTLERHMESNQNKLSNLENTIISKGVRDLPPPARTKRNIVRELPPPSYVQDEEDFMESIIIEESVSSQQQPVLSQQQPVLSQQQPVLSQQQPVLSQQQPVSSQQQPVNVAQTTLDGIPLRSSVLAQSRTNLPLRGTDSSQQQPVLSQQQPVILSGATVNPVLNTQQIPITSPSNVVLSGSIPKTNIVNRRNPYINLSNDSEDPFEQFGQQELPPPAILQTKPIREEKNCKRDISCPLVPMEVPRCKKNKDKKSVVWKL